jgi:hypothetical protein
MTRQTFVAVFAVSSLATGCGGPLLQLEVGASSVCQHLTKQAIVVPPGLRDRYAALPPTAQTIELAKTFDFDVSMRLPDELKNSTGSLTLDSVTVTAADEVTRFDFLQSAGVTLVAPANSGLAPYTLAWQRGADEVKQISWRGNAFEVGPFLRAGSLTYAVSMVGTLPATDLLVDVDACASASVTVKFSP